MKLYQTLTCLTLLLFLSSSVSEKKDKQFNVLFIGIDDLRPELGCYGEDHIISPNIDNLASQGMLFNRAYVQQAVCAASRASLLTGCYPNTTGVDYPYSQYFIDEFLPKHPSIPRYFFENGYFTVAMGKLHHGPNYDLSGLSLPYPSRDRHWKASYALPENNKLAMTGDGSNKPPVEMAEVPDTTYDDGFLAEEAIKSLQKCVKQEKPFFLTVGFKKPHLPFACPKKYWDLYDRNEISLAPVPALPENAPQFAIANYELSSGYAGNYGAKNTMVPDSIARLLRHGYFACVSFVDAQIGKVLDELDRLGLRENTVIVLWSDHGFQLGDQQNWTKHTNFELATRSPLIISYPDMKNSGERTNALVEYVDIFPTLCDLTGTPAPDYLEGTSLRPLLDNPIRSWKSAAFSQYPRGKNMEGFAIRTDRYRYVEWKKSDGEIIARELYDHKIDPQESRSVAQQYPDIVTELSKKLAAGWRAALPEGIKNNSDQFGGSACRIMCFYFSKPKSMKNSVGLLTSFFLFLWMAACTGTKNEQEFQQALQNGQLANEGYIRCNRFVEDWLQHADPETGLIPRNLKESKDFWNAKDAAADNYPFMVLTAAITNRELFNGTMYDMLVTETKLTSRLGSLPDDYSFSKEGFMNGEIDTAAILFGASEYVKDGLLPLTEWIGKSPWSERMIAILDDIWLYAQVSTPFGKIPSENVELNGEMMQVLSRVYWMTGDEKYLEWATRLADYYLLGNHHPTRDFTSLRLRDHGCEVVSGLCEVYVMVHFAAHQKKKAYEKPINEMLHRILKTGTNLHGMFYNVVNPQTGEVVNARLADTWGYTYNGYYSVYLLDSMKVYHKAVLQVLSNLNLYESYDWESNSADGYADAIESALNLFAREPVQEAAEWIDSQTQIMWHMQDSAYSGRAAEWTRSGIIEGWHGDGNFARTTIMYNLWKTQGTTIQPWREDVVYGAVQSNGKLYIALKTEDAWEGELVFDMPRHRINLNLPVDYPRINQFPEWFVAEAGKSYKIKDLQNRTTNLFTGEQLAEGIKIQMKSNGISFFTVEIKN